MRRWWPEEGSETWVYVAVAGFYLLILFGAISQHYEEPVWTP